jgi:hypothetical protein
MSADEGRETIDRGRRTADRGTILQSGSRSYKSKPHQLNQIGKSAPLIVLVCGLSSLLQSGSRSYKSKPYQLNQIGKSAPLIVLVCGPPSAVCRLCFKVARVRINRNRIN